MMLARAARRQQCQPHSVGNPAPRPVIAASAPPTIWLTERSRLFLDFLLACLTVVWIQCCAFVSFWLVLMSSLRLLGRS
jgi:hypothetical protein